MHINIRKSAAEMLIRSLVTRFHQQDPVTVLSRVGRARSAFIRCGG